MCSSANNASIFWFSGLSGSGKTTIVNLVVERLSDQKKKIRVLDGDVVRKERNHHLGFTPADIRENNRIISDICSKERPLYDHIFVPIISPFEDSRAYARKNLSPNFYLVYVKAPLETVIKRDVKGLYWKALQGKIDNFIGIHPDVPFETPKDPDLVIATDMESVTDSVNKLLNFVYACEKK